MKNVPKKLLIFLLLNFFLNGCLLKQKEKFATDAPIKKLVFDLPFPNDLIYRATPDAQVIVGTKEIEAYLNYEVSGFDLETGGKLWQLPFAGKVVGRTEKQILVFEEKTSTVHFITPRSGEITRRISPAPILLTRINFDLYSGMAFTDEMYLTTKALYTNVFSKVNEKDESFPIGITAKTWANNETVWFVPPDGQLVTVSYPPLVFGDKVLLMSAPYGKTTVPAYKGVSLKTGAELFRVESNGDFHYLADKYFIETTPSFVRRIEPLTGKELWKIPGVENHFVSAIADQITLHSTDKNKIRTIRIVEAETGKLLKQFEFSSAVETRLEAAFLTKDGSILLNFNSKISDRPFTDHEHYNYWVAYDAEAKKVLWRTDFESHSDASLFPFASDKVKVEH